MAKDYPETPDGRYFVSKGRLWRKTDPSLPDSDRRAAIKSLMQARRAVRDASTESEERAGRDAVQEAKEHLGERGPVWWTDDAPDLTRHAPWNTVYADWWNDLPETTRTKGL
ncbi:hypothetical protein JSE7799_01650 [Jannaschia seosinensis]|uniref:Uncharacterized protein n=1 Tax=Jannaschia seosinensis TaxID=313367 RepID=A0A0M7B978_9RHOB|nr:hypothetical protein [Jannaschia seosinensis]CUH38931.1 hypothetical protein JSE7799_01650 [Jannaschia seosinensis]